MLFRVISIHLNLWKASHHWKFHRSFLLFLALEPPPFLLSQGCSNDLSWGGYGYMLEQHIPRFPVKLSRVKPLQNIPVSFTLSVLVYS